MEVGNPSMDQGKGKKPSKDGRTKRGCIEVYTDVEKGLETYKIGGTLVTQRILTDYEEEIYAQYSPYNIAGLKKIQISSPPSPPRPRPSPPIDQAVLKERYQRQTAKVAEVALAYFNKKHRTDYELVEALHSAPEYDQDGNWMHANFTAKLKTAPDGGDGDSSIKLFFAERRSTKPGRFEITACCIIDGVKASTPCGICPNNGLIRHPTRFRKGRYSYQLRYLRPRKVRGSKI